MRSAPVLFLTASLTAMALPALAQRPLLNSEVRADTARQAYGPNRRHYRHLFAGYLPVIGQPKQPGADLRFGSSAELVLGLREKLRLSPWLAVGAEVRYVRLQYRLVQNAAKLLPTPAQHERESLVLQRADLEGWLRLNAGRRGNAIGNYLDLAGWGGYVFGTAHHTQDQPNGPLGRRVAMTTRGLPYVQPWNYGVGARLGSGRLAAVARYRLSDSFRGAQGATYPELPRLTLGLELGLFL